MEVTDFVSFPEQGGFLEVLQRIKRKLLSVEINFIQSSDNIFFRFILFGLKKLQKLVFILIGEVKNKTGTFLKFYQNALPLREISSFVDIRYLYKRPIFFNWFVLCQYKWAEIKMRIFLEGGNIFESKVGIYFTSFFSFILRGSLSFWNCVWSIQHKKLIIPGISSVFTGMFFISFLSRPTSAGGRGS